jgi:Flp pilus assembly pilin Flp
MKRFLQQVWREDDGVLSFEWVLLVTLLVIGIVGGLAGARDAIIDELGDIAQATLSFDQSYSLPELVIDVNNVPVVVFPAQDFQDDGFDYAECDRTNSALVPDQAAEDDSLDGG